MAFPEVLRDDLVWRIAILELFKIGRAHHNGRHLYLVWIWIIEDVDIHVLQLSHIHRLDRVLVPWLVAFRLLRYVLVVHSLSILLRLRFTKNVSVVVTYVKFDFLAALRSSLSTYLLEVVFVVDSGRTNGVIACEILTKTLLLLVKLTVGPLHFVHVEVHGASTHIGWGLGPLHIALRGHSCVLHVIQLSPSASSVCECGEVSLVLGHEVRLSLHLSWCRSEA